MKENQSEKPVSDPRSPDQGGDNRVLLEKESSRIHTLCDVLHPENMQLAWQRVRANKGAAGIDNMSVGDFPAFFENHGETMMQKLRDGRYRPSPVKQCRIPKANKANGGYRTLGIPTVLDRVIQQAIAQVLSPHYEAKFSDHSYGYRPHRSAQGAVEKMHGYALDRGKNCHVVDCDLKAFFDTVDHQKLMAKLRESIADRELLGLLMKYLKAGAITVEGKFIHTPEGVPQGGPLSPLLANILLDELDSELESREHEFVRYADDFVIMCKSPRAGARILESVSRYLRTKLKLIVNTTKSKVVALKDARFLGFKIYRRKIRWTDEAKMRFKSEVKRITSRTRGVAVGVVYRDLRDYLRGALNYYMMGVTFREVRELDSWIRRRMRMFY